MLLGEIIDQVDTLVPNSLPLGIKISWVNQIQNQLYRDYLDFEAVHVFYTVKGAPAYILPADCPVDRIRAIVIDEKEYDMVPAGGDPGGSTHFWTSVVTGDILIHPTPDQTYKGVLYYRPRPLQLTEKHLEKKPMFPEDFHEMLVFGCCARVAKTTKDYLALAPVYTEEYEKLAIRADRALNRNRPKKARVVRSWI